MKKYFFKLTDYILAFVILYLLYLVVPLRHNLLDFHIIKLLTLVFGNLWKIMPLFLIMSSFVNSKKKIYIMYLYFIVISLNTFYNVVPSPKYVSSIRPVFLAYVAPSVLTLMFSYLFWKKRDKNYISVALISLLFLVSIAVNHFSLSVGTLKLLNGVIRSQTGLIGVLIYSSLITSIGLAFSVYLLVIMSMVLSYLLIKELVSYVVDTFYKKPIIQKKKKVEVNALDRIFKEVKIDPDLIEKANRAVQNKVSLLENMLKEYGVESQVVNTVTGPSITRFELAVAKGTRVKKVTALSDDIAMNLAAKSVRIEAPIPGKSAIGIEIPNDVMMQVHFSSIIKKKNPKNHLEIVLGKNIVGEDVLVDLRKMPHLLVAGRTGSGKSVGINTFIASILYTASPKDVKMIMIDPKMVELMPYNGIPHLYVPVITDPKLASNALNWAVQEMERRYRLLADSGVRHIDSYNNKVEEKIPYLVIIIDELADLMMVAPASIESSIARIAQKARAVGIHLVIATQRPSIDVITGTIKANLPSRISFSVTSQIDSRTILDKQGAEKLLGKGDMLFLESGKSNLVRIQGAYISDEEVNNFAQYLRTSGMPNYNNEIVKEVEVVDRDAMYEKAVEIITDEGRVSTSLIQRKLKVGYSRAARIMDQLEDAGIIRIGPGGEKEIVED
ncbi:MAG TPA: cell division protein FtsK [Fusobacteria bacterium]|nr:cell division protein FtsK [Fusobacteriota bacterium]